MREIAVPCLHICGSRDRDHLAVAQNQAILGRSLGHATLDIGAWRIVLWRADSRIRRMASDGFHGFVLAEADLLRLAGIVRAADRPLASSAAARGPIGASAVFVRARHFATVVRLRP